MVLGLLLGPAILKGESEPNDKLGEANELPLNGQQQGLIQHPGEYDWYQIACPQQGRLDLKAIQPPSNLRVELAMYGRHAQWISLYRSAVNPGDDVFLSMDIVEPGIYFLRFRDLNSEVSDQSYTLANTFTPALDPNEPNSQIGYATLFSSSSMQGRVFPSGDQDFFRIFVTENKTVEFTIEAPESMRAELALYDHHFGWMSTYASAINDGDTVHLERLLENAGFYYLRVRDLNGRSHTDAYSISVSGGEVGHLPAINSVTTELEPNFDSGVANSIDLGQAVTGAIGESRDQDWYAFHVTEPQQMTLTMESYSQDLLLRAEFFEPSKGHLLTGQSGHAGDAFAMTYDFVRPGKYFLRIRSLNDGFNEQSYQFYTMSVPVNDPFEPNGDSGDAAYLTQLNQIRGYFFPTGDADWFRVHVAEPGTLTAIVSGLPSNITPSIDFYNQSKDHRAGRSGAAGVDLRVSFEVSAPGDFFVRVRDSGNNDMSTDDYTLTLLGASFESYAPVARIHSIDPGAVVVGDSISFEGSGSDIDGTIAGYQWRSSIDGVISDQAGFQFDDLSIGTHDIYFKVQDNDGIWSTAVKELVYVGSSISEEVEPNGNFFDANEFAMGRPLTGKVEERGEHDFYKVYVPGAGHVKIELTNVPVNLRMELALYNRYWDWLSRYNTATESGDDVGLTIDTTNPGFLYVRVRDVSNQTNPDFTYTLAAYFESAPDPFEPNGGILQAPVMPNAMVEGYLFPGGDVDWYRIWAEPEQTLIAEVNSLPADVRAEVAIFGRNREWLSRYQSSTNPGDSVSSQIDVTQPGYYFIRVRTLEGRNWVDPYTLSITGGMAGFVPENVPSDQEIESNDVIADSNYIAVGSSVEGVIEQRHDEDWYAFDVTNPGLLEVSVDQIPNDLRGRIHFYSDDVAHLATRQATNAGDPLLLEVRLTKPGRYYVRMDHVGGELQSSRPYRLGLTATPIVDIYEPNNRFQDATQVSQQNRVEGYMFDTGDSDWYRVSTQEGHLLRVTVGDVPTEIRPQIEIFDFHANQKANKRATNDGQSITLEYMVPTTGNYSIRVSDVGNNSISVQPYTLLIDGASFESYVPMAFIDEMIPNPAGENEIVGFGGHGEDTDGSIIGYEWRSSNDGVFSVSQNATSENLSTGVHEIFFKVKDNDQNWSPETSEILFLGVPAPQEEEPNDIAGSSTLLELDRQYKGRIDKSGDYDWYRIPVPGPGTLILNVVNPSDIKMRTEMAMYTPDIGWASVNTSAANEGDPVTLRWDLGVGGLYYLRLRDLSNHVDAEYTLTAHVERVEDAFEPNHDFTNASPIRVDDVLDASIFPAGEYDWYEVSIPTPGAFHASLTSVPASMRMEIAIYGSDLNWMSVYASGGNPGDNVFRDLDISVPGTYFLRVRDLAGTRDTQDTYTLKTSFEPVIDVFEPNHDFWNAKLVTQSPVQAFMFPGGDHDYYRLFAPGGPLNISIEQMPLHMRMELALYDTHFGWMSVYQGADEEGDPVAVQIDDASGYYYLRVRERDNDRSPVEPYQLVVQGASFDHVVPTDTSESETEPNDRFAFATRIQLDTVTGLYEGNEDWYQFEVPARGELVLELISPSSNRSRLDLFNRNASHLTGRQAENKGDASRFVYSITEPGLYSLRVMDGDNATSEEPYQLTVSLNADPDSNEPNPSYSTAEPIQLGVPVVGNIFPVGDHDWFKFEVPETGTVHLSLLNQSGDVQSTMLVYDEDLRQLLHYDALHSLEPIETSLWIETPGLYWVRVNDRRDDQYSLQSYTLTAQFAPAKDAYEPNDRFRSATSITEMNQVQAIIYPGNDWDWYRFDVQEIGTIRVQVAQAGGIQPDLRFYDDSGSLLSHVYARNTGETVMFSYDITQPDTYYVSVRDDDEARVSTEPYVLTIEGAHTTHHAPMAEPLFEISPNPVLAGQSVKLTGEGTQIGGAVVDYEWTSNISGVLGNASSITVQDLPPGIHSIGLRVRNTDGVWSGRVQRNLIVAPEILSESEYNNDWESAYSIPLNTWVTGHILPRGEHDYYRVYIDQCGSIRVLVDAVPNGMRPEIAMYGANGEWLSLSTSAPHINEWTDLGWYGTPGYYHIRIRNLNNAVHSDPYALKVFFTPAGDRFEPNAAVSQATQLGLNDTLEGLTICPRGDEDWYRVDTTEHGRLRLDLSSTPQGMRPEIALFDRHFGWMSVYTSAINPGEPIHLIYDIIDTGAYYIRVRDLHNQGHTEPYVLRSQFAPVVDVNEPNFGHGVATLLESAQVQGYIFRGGEEDWYRIHAQEGAMMQCSLTQMPAAMRSEIAIFGVERQWLSVYNQAFNAGDNVYLNYTVPRTGIYYLRVRDLNSGSHTEPYTFNVEGELTYGFEPEISRVVTEVEDNSEWSSANDVALDTEISGAIETNRDNDRYRFWINAPGVLRISHTQIHESITSEMWVYNKHLNQIGHRTTTNPGEDNLLELAITDPGWYILRIADRGQNHSSTDPYKLHLSHTPVVDEYEPNNGLGDATQLGNATVQGYLFAGDDVDWYRVYVREPGTLSVSLEETPEVNRPRLRIYDPNGSERGNWVNTNPGVGGEDVIVYEATTPGFYYLRVNDEGRQYGGQPYTIRIDGADFSQAPTLAGIGDRTIEATIPYAFRVSAKDPDNMDALVFTAQNMPPGATFDPVTRLFEWTPLSNQAGEYSGITFEVSDGDFSDSESITITVASHNLAPTLHPIGHRDILVDTEYRLTLVATDPNPGAELSFSADHLPRDAEFDPQTPTFTWTPAANQLGEHSNILFVVTDGERSDFEYITLNVVEELEPLDPRDIWWATHFTEAELADPHISGLEADPDGDGMINGQELEADTNPRDPHSLLRILRIAELEHMVEIHWIGGKDSVQYLQVREHWGTDATWKTIRTFEPPTPLENSVTDEQMIGGEAYFRIVAERP